MDGDDSKYQGLAHQLPRQLPGDARPALSRLVRGHAASFGAKNWGRRPLHVAAATTTAATTFEDLVTTDVIDDLIATRGLRSNDITMTKNGSTIPWHRLSTIGNYAPDGEELDSGKVLSEFCDGASITFPTMERLWPPLRAFSAALHADLGHPVNTAATTSPPGTADTIDVYDTTDTFVVQISGMTTWQVVEPLIGDPLPTQPWHSHASDLAEHVKESVPVTYTMQPGDVLYLPRGYIYRRETGSEASTSLAFSITVWNAGTIADLLISALRDSLTVTPELRVALPIAPDVSDPLTLGAFVASVQHNLAEALKSIDPVATATTFNGSQRRAVKPESLSTLQSALSSEAVCDTTRLALRGGIDASWERPGLLSGQPGVLIVDANDEPHVNLLLRDGTVKAGDLSEDHDKALEMAKRLIRGGWVRVMQ